MKSQIVKENHIGPAVSEILWHKQTDILLLLCKDMHLLENKTTFIYKYALVR